MGKILKVFHCCCYFVIDNNSLEKLICIDCLFYLVEAVLTTLEAIFEWYTLCTVSTCPVLILRG